MYQARQSNYSGDDNVEEEDVALGWMGPTVQLQFVVGQLPAASCHGCADMKCHAFATVCLKGGGGGVWFVSFLTAQEVNSINIFICRQGNGDHSRHGEKAPIDMSAQTETVSRPQTTSAVAWWLRLKYRFEKSHVSLKEQ